MDLIERRQFEQMRAALTEIRDKAATMENGGAWAGGMAMLCLGTLPRREASSPKITMNRRYMRAQLLLGHTMSIVGKHICDCDHSQRNHHRDCARELLDLFFDSGAQIITDAERAEAGLPPRDEHGMTEDELQILENHALAAMRATAPMMMSPLAVGPGSKS
jgi:hypothetical protein